MKIEDEIKDLVNNSCLIITMANRCLLYVFITFFPWIGEERLGS